MPKTKISEYSATANSNTDVASINIDEGCAPSGINNAIRAIMGHLKDFQSGTSNDPFTVGASGSLTLSYGTANGVAYLNGSKVLTTGSALTYDGTNLTVNTGTVSATYGKLTVAGGISITPDSSSKFQIGRYSAGAPYSYIKMGSTSSGLKFTDPADSVDLATLDSAGNLGLGVTPSAWASGTYKAFQVSGGGAISGSTGQVNFSQNWVGESGADKYISNGFASSYAQALGVHKWFNAPSGTAGNPITFTQAMTLDASGNLGVGTSSPTGGANRVVDVYGSSSSAINFHNATSGTTATDGGLVGQYGSDLVLYNYEAGIIQFGTSNAERARIDSSGNLLVGTTSGGTSRIYAEGGSSYHSIRALANTAGNVAIYGVSSANSSTGYCAYFNNSGSGTGLFISNTAAWQSVSDARLKDDVQNLNTTSKLLQLRPVDYLWKNQATSNEPEKRSLGFIAQEVQELFPELVGVSPDGFLSVEYTGFIAPLVKAIQEQQAIITQLQADVAALKGA